MKTTFCALLLALATCTDPAVALTPQEILVVHNTASPIGTASTAVAAYYAAAREIPSSNLLGINCRTTEYNTPTEYQYGIANSISTYLSSHPDIKCIVLCYGIPSTVGPAGPASYYYSVDSALTLLGNTGIPSATPWGVGATNPYCDKNVDFAKFKDSADNHITGPSGQSWKLNYLVARLDGFSEPTEEVTVSIGGTPTTVAIPRDVKALVDRSVSAEPGGRFVIDRSGAHSLKNSMVGAGMTATDIVAYDYEIDTPTYHFLTGEDDVIGYFGQHFSDGNANNYTTWGRPFHDWLPGGVALANTNDGQSFRTPQLFWGPLTQHGTASAHTLTITDMHHSTTTPDRYAGHQVFVCAGNGSTLAQGTFSLGTCSIDLSSIAWPTDPNNPDLHPTYFEIRFPADDPQHAGEYIPDSRTPASPDNALWNARVSGITYSCGYDDTSNRIARVVSAEYVAEGASGALSIAMEGGLCHNATVVLPRYACGYTWAESAYMGMSTVAWQQVVLGDPLMAPFAASPTVAFAPPSPADRATAAGTVTLSVSAGASSTASTIDRVEFWTTESGEPACKVATAAAEPYECAWDTAAVNDGTYAVDAVAYQTGNPVGSSSISRTVTVGNASTCSVSIVEPENEDTIVTSAAAVAAEASGTPDKVEFWLIGEGTVTCGGTATTSPYESTITSAIPNGVYDLQAVAYYGSAAVSYSERRRILFVNSPVTATSVAALGSQDNDTDIFLVDVPVVAGTSSAMGGAFYVEDQNRASGIRVESTASIATGERVMVSGTLHKSGTGVIERYIEAERVWDLGPAATVPSALAMRNASLGGAAPDGTVGITDGIGLYNLGMLVRTWGKVTYVGSDFVYVDDGCALGDGNSLEAPIIVSLDGGEVPTTHPTGASGLCVRCGSFSKPGIGDYVLVTGISSATAIGAAIKPCLRLRSQQDSDYPRQYTRCAKKMYAPYNPLASVGYFADVNQSPLPLGSCVRMRYANVIERYDPPYDPYLLVRHCDSVIDSYYLKTWVAAHTQLPYFAKITVVGTSVPDYVPGYSEPDHCIQAECLYLGGSEHGILRTDEPSLASVDEPAEEAAIAGGGPCRPLPPPSADEVLASGWFARMDSQAGSIGWALSRPDGSAIDLVGEMVVTESRDGSTFGIKELFEPMPREARLVLCMDEPVTTAGLHMATLDISGATLITLADGRRALVRPRSVDVYTDAHGTYTLPTLSVKSAPDLWPCRTRIVP